MTSVEDQLAALQAKLQEMETQLQHQGTSQASGSTNQAAATQSIKVTVPREKKFGRYNGTRDDRVLEDWIADAERAVRAQQDGEAVDSLIFHLEGVAKEEVKLRPTSQWSTPAGVFKILRETFSEQLTHMQALRKFFARKQLERESVHDFAHSLMVLLARVERLATEEVPEKDKMLKEQFVENLRDPTLRRDIKRWVRDHPDTSFQDVRLELHRYMEEDCTTSRRPVAAVREVTQEEEEPLLCGEVRGTKTNQKVLSDLITGQKVLAEELQKQQRTLVSHIEQQRRVLEQQQQTVNRLLESMALRPRPTGCFGCGEEGHYRKDCPKVASQDDRKATPTQSTKKPQKPALNFRPPQH